MEQQSIDYKLFIINQITFWTGLAATSIFPYSY